VTSWTCARKKPPPPLMKYENDRILIRSNDIMTGLPAREPKAPGARNDKSGHRRTAVRPSRPRARSDSIDLWLATASPMMTAARWRPRQRALILEMSSAGLQPPVGLLRRSGSLIFPVPMSMVFSNTNTRFLFPMAAPKYLHLDAALRHVERHGWRRALKNAIEMWWRIHPPWRRSRSRQIQEVTAVSCQW